MSVLASLVYVVVQIIFIPFAIIGIGLVAYKQLFVSKKLGVSSTAVEIINGRWTMDVFGIRTDPATVRLSRALPNNSITGLWMALFPLYLRYKISGKNAIYPVVARAGEEGITNLVVNRTLYIDEIIAKSKDRVEQFVLMGAGFDTRAYGEMARSGLKFFELDQENMQRLKQGALAKAEIDISAVTYVSVDFSRETWHEKLKAAGFDPGKQTVFLWEGVTLYLSEADVRQALREIKENTAPGTIIVADFYALMLVKGEMYPTMKTQLKALKITNEEFGFGLDFSANYEGVLKNFIESEGLKLGQTHFMGASTKKGVWMAVSEIIV